jgi:hypothetical protein
MEGSIVNTGHVYTVEDGDVIDWVVRKFGSSRASILEFNRDVAQVLFFLFFEMTAFTALL